MFAVFGKKLMRPVLTVLAIGLPLSAPHQVKADDNFTVVFNGLVDTHIYKLNSHVRVATGLTVTHTEYEDWNIDNFNTRYGFTATGDTALGAFTAKIEGGWLGDQLAIRHAFGQVGPILAGQTDSLMREGMPFLSGSDDSFYTIESISAPTTWRQRQQLRYTTHFGDATLAVALEDNFQTNSDFFDITANLQTEVGSAKIAVAALYDPTRDDQFVITGSASFKLGPADAFVTGTFSQGILGLQAVGWPDASSIGVGVGAHIPLDDNLTAFVGAGRAENQTYENTINYFAGSLTWSPLPQHEVGGRVQYSEYFHGNFSGTTYEYDYLLFDTFWRYKL